MQIRKSNERGHSNLGWLDSYHTFSFSDYYDPDWMGFRSLRVINDDLVMPGMGFGMHPHRDMEILTVVLSGQLEHKDSMGNGRVIRAGEVQYMSAGSGVLHSEFNPSREETVHFLQIWISPEVKGAEPRYAERSFAGMPRGEFHLIASKTGREGSLAIRQEADLWLAQIVEGEEIAFGLRPQRHAWIHVAEGELEINGQLLLAGDAVAFSGENQIQVHGRKAGRVLLFDLN